MVQGHTPLWWESQGSGNLTQGHIVATIRKQGVMDTRSSLVEFPSFILSRFSARKWCQPWLASFPFLFLCSFLPAYLPDPYPQSSHSYQHKTVSQRHVRRPVSQVILDSVKLAALTITDGLMAKCKRQGTLGLFMSPKGKSWEEVVLIQWEQEWTNVCATNKTNARVSTVTPWEWPGVTTIQWL